MNQKYNKKCCFNLFIKYNIIYFNCLLHYLRLHLIYSYKNVFTYLFFIILLL